MRTKHLLLPFAFLAILAACLFFPLLLSSTPKSQAAAVADPAQPSPTPSAQALEASGGEAPTVTLYQSSGESDLQISGRPTPHAYFDLFEAQYTGLSFEEKLEKLRSVFPEGKYWNTMNSPVNPDTLTQQEAATIVTDTPCNHTEKDYDYCHEYDGEVLYGYYENIQCLGFASLISDFLFGKDAPLYEFYRIEDLQPGDHIRYNDYEHSMIVTQVMPNAVKVVECNRDYETCLIEWDRELTTDELLGYDVVFYTRKAAEYATPVNYFENREDNE